MPDMKTDINHNLLTHTILNINHVEYSEQTVKFISRVIEYLINNTIEKVSRFARRYFMHTGFERFGQEGRDAMTKEMEQIYRRVFFILFILNHFFRRRIEVLGGI